MTSTATRSTETHRARIAGIIEAKELRAAVASSYQAVSYFAGTHIMTQIVLPDRLEFFVAFDGGDAALLVCNLETGMVKSQTDIPEIHEYVEFANVPADALARLLRDRGVTSGRVGIELRRLHAEGFADLRNALPELELVGIDEDVEAAQAVKEEDEIEMLQYGA